MPKNYYLVLGIPADSTQREVKAAYRRLVKKFHPDLCSDEPTPFLGIQEAYAVLGDPERRREYDEHLWEGARKETAGWRTRPPAEAVEPLIPDQPPDFGSPSIFSRSYRPYAVSLFEQMLGSSFKRGRTGGESQAVEVTLTPQQAGNGGSLRLLIPAWQRCRACGGRGGRGFFACLQCGDTGIEPYDYHLRLEFPPGVTDNSTFYLPIEGFGQGTGRLTIRFRIRC